MINNSNFIYSNAEERQKLKERFLGFKKIDKLKRTILFTTPSETGTSFFRLFTPMLAMAEKYPHEFNYVYWEQENFPVEWLHKVDLWVQHRAGSIHSNYLDMVKLFPMDVRKPVTIHDVDDNEMQLPPNHSMREMWYATGKDQMAKYQLSNVDYITTTGRALKREFSKYNKHDNIEIFRNTFNWDLPQWNLEKPVHEKITIGWAGLTSHVEDLKKMSRILKVIHDKYPNVVFKIAGITHKDEQYVYKEDENGEKRLVKEKISDPTQTYKYRVSQMFNDFDKDRIELIGVLPLEEYGKFYTMWDINLAYVEHNTFNSQKSEIKIVEGARYKNINIYSNIGGYQEYTNFLPGELKKIHIKHCAMRTEQVSEWVDSISFWVNAIREKNPIVDVVKEKSYDFVTDFYHVKNQVDKRLDFYKTCIYNKNKYSLVI